MQLKTGVGLTGKDILLLLVYFAGIEGRRGISGATRLMKAVFIFEKEIKKDFKADISNFPEFIPWKFGPWSKDVLEAVEFFKSIKFIDVEEPADGHYTSEKEELNKWLGEVQSTGELKNVNLHEEDYTPEGFILTAVGKSFVESKLLPHLSESQIETLKKFSQKIVSLSLYTILEYVYRKYGSEEQGWTEKSLIKDKFLSK